MTPAEKFSHTLQEHSNSPFLFIGSGFSQRYLGTPTWEALLRKFSSHVASYEYYFSSADSKLPRCASLIASDYAKYWWTAPELEEQREKNKHLCISNSSPLKISIAETLSNDYGIKKDHRLADELNALRALNAEGIITTNWDGLLESLFPEHKVYIGQQSIVGQTPQNIGEILKIHGCYTFPNSLVITEEDYKVFHEKQAYLAAKLITIFVEHPIVFIGYSITDPNIHALLRAILHGLGTEEIGHLQRNLIFVQRSTEKRPAGIAQTILVVDDMQLPITNLVVDDFVPIYAELARSKMKLPVHVLRFCKEQLYEIVSAKIPSEKMCLSNIDDIKNHKDIEFIAGLGVVSSHMADRGYHGLETRELFQYVITGAPLLDERVLSELSKLDTGNNFLPVFRFLKEAGITELPADDKTLMRLASHGRDFYKTKSYAKPALRETSQRDFCWIVANFPPEKAAVFIPYLPDDRIPVDELHAFTVEHFEKAFGPTYSTMYRKLFCLYDYLKFGGNSFSK